MYLKITRSGPRRYLQIVEAYRDPGSGRPKQRHIATLGRVDQLSEANVDGLIEGLLKFTARPDLETLSEGIRSAHTTFETALQLGDVWVLSRVWQQLKLGAAIRASLQGRRYRTDIEYLVRVLVINRLSDPESKLGVLRWLATVYLPGRPRPRVTHQQLLRAMDALLVHQAQLERQLTQSLLPQFAPALEVVFYDLTTIGVQGESEREDDLRQYGYAKGGGTQRQFTVGVVQTAEGLPITHEVFEGHVGEVRTVRGIVERLCERFVLQRLVVIADRGMLSLENLELLERIRLPRGRAVEYIVAVPARRCTQLTAALTDLHRPLVKASRRTGAESIAEAPLSEGRRLVVAHDPQRAQLQRRQRRRQLREVLTLAAELHAKLEAQEAGGARRGRRLTDHGAKCQLQQAVAERRLSSLLHVDQAAELFSWWWDQRAFRSAWQRDGKLVLITNVADLEAAAVISRYKARADSERGFRVLKSELAIAPVYHRLPERIRAHTFLCFLALVVQRVLRHRLYQHRVAGSPQALLEQLQAIQRHQVRLPTGKRLVGISRITPQQQALFEAVAVEVPTEARLKAAV
jgi:transposase